MLEERLACEEVEREIVKIQGVLKEMLGSQQLEKNPLLSFESIRSCIEEPDPTLERFEKAAQGLKRIAYDRLDRYDSYNDKDCLSRY